MNIPTLNDLHFRIRRTSLERAQTLAALHGVALDVSDVDAVSLALRIYEARTGHITSRMRVLKCFELRMGDSDDLWLLGCLREAERIAADHLEITAHAPRSEWSVVALADRSDGAPMFHTIDPTVPYWTPETMDGIDFQRCDECGVRSHRNRAFIVARDGVTRQIGGSCAKHLDLTKKLRDLLDGFQSFIEELRASSDEFGECCGPRGIPEMNLPLAVCVADEYVGLEGYVSRKASEAAGRMATAQAVDIVVDGSSKLAKEMRLEPQWKRAVERWNAGDGETILASIATWLDAQPDDQFHRNIRTAVRNSSRRYLGLTVFAVAELRNWRLMIEQKAKKVAPYCYLHAAPDAATSPEDVAAACNTTVEALAALLGHDLTLRKGKVAAPARKALQKVLSGVWTVTARASWVSEFTGEWKDMIQLTREDGARVKWITGSLPDRDGGYQKGDKFLILSASVGETQPDDPKYGCPGTKVSRVTLAEVPGTDAARKADEKRAKRLAEERMWAERDARAQADYEQTVAEMEAREAARTQCASAAQSSELERMPV